jgi:hypothetical protein
VADKERRAFQHVKKRIATREQEATRLERQIKQKNKGDDPHFLKGELEIMRRDIEELEKTTEVRLLTTDATIEKLGMLLNENPNGLLVERDELTGFFNSMEQEGHQQDRGFYMESWSGTRGLHIDRVGRGSLWVPNCILSILGTIQPEPLAEYLTRYYQRGRDGFIERFQVVVYPELSRWTYRDQSPDQYAYEQAMGLFAGLHAMQPATFPLRFDSEAQAVFEQWVTWWMTEVARNPKVHPVLRSHFSKYRKLMPALALLFQLAEDIADESAQAYVKAPAARMAIQWCEYLSGHALRIYWPIIRPGGSAAQLLAAHLPALAGQRLTAREFVKKGWSGLESSETVEEGLGRLATLHWVRPEAAGRWGTETRWAINPSLPSLPAEGAIHLNSILSLPPSLRA